MDCKYFDSCSAPLCPKYLIVDAVWCPDEPICQLKEIPEWVKRQKKIAKKASFEASCFTLKMIKHNCRIVKGIKGINPDLTNKEKKEAEKLWLNRHFAIKPLNNDKKAEFVMRAGFARLSLHRKTE